MTEKELQDAIAAMPPGRRAIYEIIRERGPVTIREIVEAQHGHPSRKASLTDRLKPLQRDGLIYSPGKRRVKDRDVLLWVATPAPDIERWVHCYQEETRRRLAEGRQRRGSHQRRAQEFRRLQTGDYDEWYTARERLVWLAQVLPTIEAAQFWEAAPPEDREDVIEDLAEIQEWISRVYDAYLDRAEDDQLRERVAKLRATNGRTPEEAAAFRRKANRLSRRLR
jgi:hypothetical protein